jgi:outer membrane protein OmpA-like peptidoglycan-associated protein
LDALIILLQLPPTTAPALLGEVFMRILSCLVLTLVVALLFFSVQPVEAQIFDKLKNAVTKAAEDETANQLDRMIREGFHCVFSDLECIEKAEADGQTIVLTDADGEPIVDDDGALVSDPKTAAEMVGEPPAAEGPSAPGSDIWANYDFVPGEEILYVDDFTDDEAGDFPRRLEWLRGNMELVEWEGRLLLRANGESQFAILLEDGVPEQFTLEFDIHDPQTESGTVIVTEEVTQNARDRYQSTRFNFGSWRGSGIWREREPLSTTEDERMATEIVTARIMVDGAHAKLFINEKRISNAPRIELARGDRITFEMWGRDDHPIYLGNIRLAAGGRDLYDDLIEKGRVATHGILFDVNSDRIRPESTPTLEEIGEMLADHADLRISIEGHTDADGDDASNQALSEKRAAAVRSFLMVTYSVDAGRLESVGVGETKPVAPNDTPEGKQQNRRVELVVL